MSIPAKYLHAAGCLLAQVAGEELSRQELDEVAWAGYRRGDGAKVAEALRGILRNGAAYDAEVLVRLSADFPVLSGKLTQAAFNELGLCLTAMTA